MVCQKQITIFYCIIALAVSMSVHSASGGGLWGSYLEPRLQEKVMAQQKGKVSADSFTWFPVQAIYQTQAPGNLESNMI